MRNRISPGHRAVVRRHVDRALCAAVGSINGGVTDDVALTFDDGPDVETTPRILQVLAEHRAQATFFLLAGRAAASPEVAEAIVDAGHEVGLHGLDHQRLTARGVDAGAAIAEGRSLLESIVGCRVRWFRPAFGAQRLSTFVAARRCGMDVVVWSADAADWEDAPVADVAARGVAALRPGGVLLLHDRLEPGEGEPSPVTTFDRADVVHRILNELELVGRSSRTMSDLVRDHARRTAWFRP